MLITTNKFAETTEIEKTYDVLSDMVKSLRVSGSVLFNERYASPWGISIPASNKLSALLHLNSGVHVAAFHYVKRGYVEVVTDEGSQTILEAGEMAICFGGVAHQISQNASVKSLPVEVLLKGLQNPFRLDETSQVRSTAVICGLFVLQDTALNPLFASLPSLLHLSTNRQSRFSNLLSVLEQMDDELENRSFGSDFVVERLLELLCVSAIRAHLESYRPLVAGLFNGLKDPMVSRAISMIHAKPSANWSVAQLAANVAISPTRFAARFSAAMGDSPMSYLTKWRMNIASRLLSTTMKSVGDISADVGYESVAAFNRAFKRHLGLSPTAWRTSQSG